MPPYEPPKEGLVSNFENPINNAADLYFLIQKNWHISVTKDLDIFSSMADICDQSKGDGLSFFSLSVLVCVHACACVCVYFEESNKTKYIIVNDTPHQQLKLAI